MAQLIGYDLFRTLKACRAITQTHASILDDLSGMTSNAARTRKTLERAGKRLEASMVHFAVAQQRLRDVNEQHERVMREIDAIRAKSPVFQTLS